MAGRGEPTGPDVHDASGKLPKDGSPNYRYSADADKSCRFCRHYQPDDPKQPWQGGGCEIVEGSIRAVDTCNYWTPQGRRLEAKRKKQEVGDAKLPEPLDAWQATEDEDEDEGAAGDFHMAADEAEEEAWASVPDWATAETAIDALYEAGWRPVNRHGLKWRHPKLPTHEIETARSTWTHSVDDIVVHAGGYPQLAKHVKAASKIYKTMEAARDFEARYDRD